MSVSQVKVVINGQTHTLSYNGTSGKYEATVTAPTITSYNKEGGYYPVTVEVTDDAGNKTVQDSTSETNRLIVRETIPPVISNLSPSSDARVTTAGPKITGVITDETNGSGVNTDTFVLKIDGVAVSNSGVTFKPITNGYEFTYQASGLEQGTHTVTVDCEDNDGNSAVRKSTSFIVDTIAPSLNVSAPVNNFITNKASVTVSGTTSDATSNPITIKIKLNGTDQGTVSLSSDSFSKAVTLREGTNTIVVTATDSSGLSTTVTRTVILDTVAPTITGVELIPNPVDAGATFIIKVTATDE